MRICAYYIYIYIYIYIFVRFVNTFCAGAGLVGEKPLKSQSLNI